MAETSEPPASARSTAPPSFRDRLLAQYDFPLDTFQRQADAAIAADRSVLVAAPTGAGKTVVADLAVAAALDRGLRAFYTTPIKALSNQKFNDLRDQHGADRVGLLTGDRSIDGDADVVVMTTEVLRNMIYAGRDLDDLGVVVLDEVHYLQDSFRGPVWEEVIVHLPEHVQLICLSATVSNVDDIGDWLRTVRGATDVVVEHQRPVTLTNTYLVGDKQGDRLHLLPTLVNGRPNVEADKFDIDAGGVGGGGNRKGGRPRRRWFTPTRLDVIDVLEDDVLLPAIVFVFSRKGCEEAVREALAARVRLTTPAEAAEVRAIAEAHLRELSDADLDVLGHDRWLAGLEAGVASHHAGMVPPMKEAVEACFVRGLVKVVFATETLALGINMPAKAVVIERMTKFNGESRAFLTPAEYTQLTGRAGRRGIDDHGTAIVLWSPWVSFGQIAGLAASKTYVLRSAFRPTYNMAVNLVRRHDQHTAGRLLNQSLAQYQADRAVVVLERRRREREKALAKAESAARCELGDVEEFVALADEERRVRRGRHGGRVDDALGKLRPGDVLDADGIPRVAVLSTAFRKGGAMRIQAVTDDRTVVTLTEDDFPVAPAIVATLPLPDGFRPDDAGSRRELAGQSARLRRGGGKRIRRDQDIDHPVAACPDLKSHLRARDRVRRLRRDVDELGRQVERRTGTLARQFDEVCEVLAELGHLDGWSVTDRGLLLTGIYHECDLLVAEALAAGLFDELDAPEVAVASGFVYERRAPGAPPPARFPSSRVRARLTAADAIAERIQRLEEARSLPYTRLPDPGFAFLAHEWCAGEELATLLADDDELTGGDFVRTMRQLIDLVRQISQLAPNRLTRSTARRAVEALQRGVVAATSAPASDGPEASGDGDESMTSEEPLEGDVDVPATAESHARRSAHVDEP